eukprot:766103-Hanusia_phi.AAC.1
MSSNPPPPPPPPPLSPPPPPLSPPPPPLSPPTSLSLHVSVARHLVLVQHVEAPGIVDRRVGREEAETSDLSERERRGAERA